MHIYVCVSAIHICYCFKYVFCYMHDMRYCTGSWNIPFTPARKGPQWLIKKLPITTCYYILLYITIGHAAITPNMLWGYSYLRRDISRAVTLSWYRIIYITLCIVLHVILYIYIYIYIYTYIYIYVYHMIYNAIGRAPITPNDMFENY